MSEQNELEALRAENQQLKTTSALTAAASKAGAFNTERLVTVAASMTTTDADGNVVIKLDDALLSPDVAFQKMATDDRFLNYFDANVNASVGGSNVSNSPPNFETCSYEQFKAWRNGNGNRI